MQAISSACLFCPAGAQGLPSQRVSSAPPDIPLLPLPAPPAHCRPVEADEPVSNQKNGGGFRLIQGGCCFVVGGFTAVVSVVLFVFLNT